MLITRRPSARATEYNVRRQRSQHGTNDAQDRFRLSGRLFFWQVFWQVYPRHQINDFVQEIPEPANGKPEQRWQPWAARNVPGECRYDTNSIRNPAAAYSIRNCVCQLARVNGLAVQVTKGVLHKRNPNVQDGGQGHGDFLTAFFTRNIKVHTTKTDGVHV
jgi:hypothetical protein